MTNPNYHGPCPYCGSAISVIIKDGTVVARCSHRGCGARGPIMRSLDRAVELFRAGKCAPPSPPQPDADSASGAIDRWEPYEDPITGETVYRDRFAPQPDAGRCEVCADGCYPYYGGAPGRDYAGPSERDMTYTDRNGETHTIPAGTFVLAQRDPSPRETWPDNFREDPECPGLGTWSCPACNGTGRKVER